MIENTELGVGILSEGVDEETLTNVTMYLGDRFVGYCSFMDYGFPKVNKTVGRRTMVCDDTSRYVCEVYLDDTELLCNALESGEPVDSVAMIARDPKDRSYIIRFRDVSDIKWSVSDGWVRLSFEALNVDHWQKL